MSYITSEEMVIFNAVRKLFFEAYYIQYELKMPPGVYSVQDINKTVLAYCWYDMDSKIPTIVANPVVNNFKRVN